ncbi:hypothetical protein HYS84_03075 [Candidatus Saccharibacteria bacterium]|nr:hypothetical protein [Candidatus Saccharibacteria bacterium]
MGEQAGAALTSRPRHPRLLPDFSHFEGGFLFVKKYLDLLLALGYYEC